ncbi:CpaF family protein [Thermanaerosceptrum fracticalcis]|uniref:CpaF family protein n=1 Tax=Thermanaerosceptrum fracticalcis TaxID=1712410 RepID=A0A7G6E8K5_THEFR|nr:CpaF family protein [Thermanaerosceptrum fracticalcis]QNB48409.1 CpaF family protein [Thermanaerosceptrum fracticalcis]
MSLLQRLEKEKGTKIGSGAVENKFQALKTADPYRDLKVKVHKEVIELMDTELLEQKDQAAHFLSPEELSLKVEEMVNVIVDRDASHLTRMERQKIITEILDEVIGLGPIEQLIKDPEISEIMVNGPNQIFVERKGKLEKVPFTFRNNEHVLHIIDKIVSPLGRRIDESMPMVDARLPDGSRVNAIIPPLAITGPTITIRKFSRDPLTIHDLIRFGTLTPKMATFLEACVKARLNIVISGGTGSGKTSTLNVLSSFIPENERIVTIEDAAELQLRQEHVITLESRPPNIEGKGAVTIRDLVRNSLRMRPDRIVIGEVRSGEALDMLQAMNTGHDGSLTTGHANSPRDILSRLETMVLMAGMELPMRAIREQMASAIDLIVQQARLRDGSRKITHITEVVGMEGDVITLQDIFRYENEGYDDRGRLKGRFVATGVRPKFMDKLLVAGVSVPEDLFL